MSQATERAIATWAWHEESLVSLRRALDVLDAAGVPALVVKGMVLAYLLYDDVARRPMTDVNLRVRPRDFVRAARAMRAAGFPVDWTSRQLGALVFWVGRVTVELESSVGPPGLSALGVAEMMTRSGERVLSGGLRVREPELHDHAVLLVVNAFKDKLFGCMPWALDDLELIATRLDVDTFLGRVRAARLTTIAWIVADWMATRARERALARPPRPPRAAAAPAALRARPARPHRPSPALAAHPRARTRRVRLAPPAGLGAGGDGGGARRLGARQVRAVLARDAGDEGPLHARRSRSKAMTSRRIVSRLRVGTYPVTSCTRRMSGTRRVMSSKPAS